MRRRGLLLVGAVAAATLAVAPGAPADEQVQGQPVDRYGGDVTMDQGEALTFMNADVNNHDVTADTAGSDGKPLFASPTIGTGQTAAVAGAEYLTTGSYKFHCSLHPFMTGNLTVTSNGTPKPRPGSGSGSGTGSGGGSGGGAGDTTAPTVRVSLGKLRLSSLRKTRKLPVKVTVSEAAVLNLAAAIGKKTIAGGKATFTGAGSKTLRLSLNAAGRKAVAKKRSIKLDLRAVADDPSGNKGVASASAKLRG